MELSLDLNRRYTYADYITWLDDKARELIHGFIKMMSPAPRVAHAEICSNVLSHFRVIVRKIKVNVRSLQPLLMFVFPSKVKLPMTRLIRLFSLIFALFVIYQKLTNGVVAAPQI